MDKLKMELIKHDIYTNTRLTNWKIEYCQGILIVFLLR